MNVTLEQPTCFNKLVPICSTLKNPKVQLSENSIQLLSPIEISHSENAESVNIITSPHKYVVNIQNISDKSTNIDLLKWETWNAKEESAKLASAP